MWLGYLLAVLWVLSAALWTWAYRRAVLRMLTAILEEMRRGQR